jgi:hypothetical protein
MHDNYILQRKNCQNTVMQKAKVHLSHAQDISKNSYVTKDPAQLIAGEPFSVTVVT